MAESKGDYRAEIQDLDIYLKLQPNGLPTNEFAKCASGRREYGQAVIDQNPPRKFVHPAKWEQGSFAEAQD